MAVEKSLTSDEMWRHLRSVRIKQLLNKAFECKKSVLSKERTEKDLQELQQLLGLENVTAEIREDISESVLEQSGEMFIYLISCPSSEYDWILFFKNIINNQPLDKILLTLNRLTAIDNQKVFTSRILIFIAEKFKLLYPIVQQSLLLKDLENDNSMSLQDPSLLQETDLAVLKVVSNHPVHLVDGSGNVSISSLIPFCEFGGNMSSVGVKIDQFEARVNILQQNGKILNQNKVFLAENEIFC